MCSVQTVDSMVRVSVTADPILCYVHSASTHLFVHLSVLAR